MITLHWYTNLEVSDLGHISDRLVITDLQPAVAPRLSPPHRFDELAVGRYRHRVSLDVDVDDSSYRYRALQQKPQLILKFSLPEYVDFPVGTWCEFQNEVFRLNSDKNLTKNGTRNITYNMTLGGDEDMLALYKMRNSVDGRLKYSMCAKPHELVEEVVKNLNAREGSDVWSVGTCLESTEKTVEFNHSYIDAALQSIADTFETEWEIVNHVISLHKVEYFKDDPLPLSYGRGNGFVPGLGRTTSLDEAPIKRIYTQGGTQNIDRSKYGGEGSDFPEYAITSAELRLPSNQTLEYEGRTYKTDKDGYYVERIDVVSDAVKEDSLDCSEIYPSRVGTVSSVSLGSERNAEQEHFYDVIDGTIPSDLNYNDYVIEGESATMAFQSGMLAGKEFEFKYNHAERRFKLVPQEIDGILMPDPATGYMPKNGDQYIILGVMLPKAYICDNASKTGASWDMFREAARKLYEREDPKFTFKGELQGLWAKRNWLRVGGRLLVGGYILFSDEQFAPQGIAIRITGIKDYINSPYSPTLEISNSVSGSSVRTDILKIENTEVVIEDTKESIMQYTKRRFRDAKETIEMLEDAMLGDFTNTVSPIAVLTMAMLVGDESLQFEFVESKENPVPTTGKPTYDQGTKQVNIPRMGLKHYTLGSTTISSAHTEYKCWQMSEWASPVLVESGTRYYLYAKVSRTDTDAVGEYLLSERPVGLNDVEGYYILLVGILNSEENEERSFVSLHGFTEILPGRITTDQLVSADGESVLDLKNGAMKLGDSLSYNEDGTKQLRLKFLFSENADIGGWIFRNNRLESQNGDLWLDGVKGEIHTGVLRFKTAYQGKLTDANLFWLPPTDSEKTVTLLVENVMLGHVVKCYNSGDFGKANYRIALKEYVYTKHPSGDILIGEGHQGSTYEIIVRPQETVELAFFERPYTGTGVEGSYSGRWEIVNRFSQEMFINDTDKGRFPRLLAMGRMVYNNGSPYISGDWWDGRGISGILSATRQDTGKYRISFNSSNVPSGYRVIVSGYGAIAGGTNSIKAGVWETAGDHFDVHTSDDASRNDGSFDFIIFAPNWWYRLSPST